MREGAKIMSREKQRISGKKEGTSAQEEIQKLGCRIQGAGSAKGEIKCMTNKMNC